MDSKRTGIEESGLPDTVKAAAQRTQDQVTAAWQSQVDRIRLQLESGWQTILAGIVRDRFDEMEHRLRDGVQRMLEKRLAEERERLSRVVRESSQRDLGDRLNEAGRRLRAAETRDVWVRTLLDATAGLCERAAVFSIANRALKLEGARGYLAEPGWESPLSAAPAFLSAIQSADPVVAVATPRELSEPVAKMMAGGQGGRVYLFPVPMNEKVVAVLLAEAGAAGLQHGALELLAALGAASLVTEVVTRRAEAAGLVQIGGLAPVTESEEEDRERLVVPARPSADLQARRFARVVVAKLVLHRTAAVRQARQERNLYEMFREELDAGRQEYEERFGGCGVDHLHRELVTTLARGDAALLGQDYPGALR